MMRIAAAFVAIAAGAAVGGIVFKTVGEEKIGGEVKNFASRMGFTSVGGQGALDLLDKVSPGTADSMKSVVIFTVVISLLTATAVAVAIEEVTQ